MTDRKWLVHLDDRDREQVTAALLSFADSLARGCEALPTSSFGMGGREFKLPGAMRVGGSRWAVGLNLLSSGRLSLTAPATRTSGRGQLHIIDKVQSVRDLADVPAVVARWSEEIGDKDPDRRLFERAIDERLRQMVRGCIHLVDRPWRSAKVRLSSSGSHSICVHLEPGQHPSQLYFTGGGGPSLSESMSPELVAALDAIVAEGVAVFPLEYGSPPGLRTAMPSIMIDDDRSLDVFNDDDGDPIGMMRVLRSVPTGARLLMPPIC